MTATNRLSKIRTAKGLWSKTIKRPDGFVWFASEAGFPLTGVLWRDWEDMGKPSKVTVTITPGDDLNGL